MGADETKKVVFFTRKCLNVSLQAGRILGAVELEQAGLVVLRLEPGGGLVQPSPHPLHLHILLHAVVVLLVAVLLFRVRLIVVAVVESVSGDGGGLITEDDTARVVQRCAVLCLLKGTVSRNLKKTFFSSWKCSRVPVYCW
jgi:hypothetical protein